MIGIFNFVDKITLFENRFESKIVFCILTNETGKILHYSENFLLNFNIGFQIIQHDVNIEQLVIQFDDHNEEEDQTFELNLYPIDEFLQGGFQES